jgi:hypothetical protein
MEFKTNNGIKVIINAAPFEDAVTLKNAIISKLKFPKDIDIKGADFLSKLKEFDIAPFVETLMAIDSDAEVNKSLMKCLVRCSYDSEKITEKTFENEAAREDYYEIVFQCIKVNIYPFLKGLISKLNGLSALITSASQQQK